MIRCHLIPSLLILVACGSAASAADAPVAATAAATTPPTAAKPAAPIPPTKAEVEALLAKAQDWLVAQQQPTGSFLAPDARLALGITALATDVLLAKPGLAANDAHIASAVGFIKSHKQADGGIYLEPEGLFAYGTAVSLSTLIAAGAADPETIAGAQKFLFSVQVRDKESPGFGGIGYGTPKSAGRADLSNTDLAIAALRDSGVPATDPRMQDLLTFLEHCQHLSSHNQLPWVDMSPEQAGGAIYNPDTRRPVSANAPAAPGPAPKPTAYASMTYALVSSYRELDVPAEDERITAAVTWLKAHYTPFSNAGRAPGKEIDGLYYNYWLASQTLAKLGTMSFPSPDGRKVIDWRTDLIAALTFRLRPAEGGKPGAYWINESKTWAESNPVLVTTYVVGTLKNILGTL